MAAVALVLHPHRPQAIDLAASTIEWLEGVGHEVRLPPDDAARAGRPDLAVTEPALAPGCDVVVSLGGDGTMLRSVEMAARHDVPVLGVNLGTLGYLTDTEPDALRAAIERVLAGTAVIEERMLLDVVVDAPSGACASAPVLALNEAVLEKTASGHTIRVDVDLDGERFTPYAADGLIVATPTGSTAYAFSARGPIVEPTHRAVLLTPVSPHMLFDRTLVLDDDTVIDLTVAGGRTAALVVDGRHLGDLHPGDRVRCRGSDVVARLVLSGPRDFHAILKAKFGLADR
ncbi:MAG: NAD(+)/NADH kinase [Acidimicrobiia bacterium]|nr:NAD(+)/NADH kinase [Acidimicrobiia bacterium]